MSFLDEARTHELWEKIKGALSRKQNKLTGTVGQVVGFDADGAAMAQEAPAPVRYDYSGCGGITDLLLVEINDPESDFNQTKKFEGNRSKFTNVPPGMGQADDAIIIGLREVLFFYPKRLMVRVTELYPHHGRVYYNHYNWTDWSGWYSYIQATGSNPNLLDNWYFADPVNQRGQTEYAGEIYGIDRWSGKWAGADGVLSVVNPGSKDGCVSLYRPDYAAHMVQYIEKPQYYIGQTLTFSILGKSEEGGGINIQAITDNGNKTLCFSASPATEYDLLSVSFVAPYDVTDLVVNIESTNAKKSFVKAAKLELGGQQTLAHQDESGNWVLNDPPPNKALELLKCQRYSQVFSDESLRPKEAVDFRPAMRVTPALGTIEIDGTTYYTADANL